MALPTCRWVEEGFKAGLLLSYDDADIPPY